jgi:hypothetical protein
VAGNEFRLAEYNPPAPSLASSTSPEEERPLLICPTCDEAFTPQFYRRCPWCNYQFDDGLETRLHEEKLEGFGGRVWLAVFGLVAVLAIIAGYFWWLTR